MDDSTLTAGLAAIRELHDRLAAPRDHDIDLVIDGNDVSPTAAKRTLAWVLKTLDGEPTSMHLDTTDPDA